MKWMKLFLVPGISILIFSCHKSPPGDPALVISKTEVARGEMVTAKVVNAPASARFTWKLPADIKQITTDGSKARMIFMKEEHSYTGNDYWEYEIQVLEYIDLDSIPDAVFSGTIKVKDYPYYSVPASLPAETVKPLSARTLTLRPFYAPDSTLSFICETDNSYDCLNSYLVGRDASVYNSILKASFNSVWVTDKCEPADVTAQGILFTKYYNDGKYPVEITVNNEVYKGTISVSKFQSHIEFDWPYTKGVIIEPKELHRY